MLIYRDRQMITFAFLKGAHNLPCCLFEVQVQGWTSGNRFTEWLFIVGGGALKRGVITASLAQQYSKNLEDKSELINFSGRNMKKLHACIILLGFSFTTNSNISAWLCEVAETEAQATFAHFNRLLRGTITSPKR